MTRRRFVLAGSLAALALAGLVAPFACTAPDGLERVAGEQGLVASAAWSGSAFPDYRMPGVAHAGVATGLAGAAGAALLLGLGWLVARRPKAP